MKKTVITLLLLVGCFFWSCQHHHDNSIVVMTYNIRNDYDPNPPNNWKSRKDQMTHQIRSIGPDIWGVQEALYNQLEDLKSALPEYNFIGLSRDAKPDSGEFCAIFYKTSRWKVLKSQTSWFGGLQGQVNLDAAFPRIYTWGQFADNQGNEILIVNTHLDHFGQLSRIQAAQELNTLAKISKTSILMGDLNCLEQEETIEILNQNWKDSWTKNSKGEQGTFNGFNQDYDNQRRIDYIFYRGLKLENQRHDNTRLTSGNFISDHFPVIATFKY
ncbi:endonuclease/exonuclease/phosphatase family protein [Flavobacteriaceae bacterium]|nr:endonuclease/exonuclease/phosphatase family protein [Flavobacteriaceae bacterium]